MVNWKDPQILALCNEIFRSLSHVAIGAYLWEAFSTFGFEWSIITRKRAFKWPMALYAYCKWILVAAFTGMLIALNVHTKINCQALYTFNQFAGHSSIGSSSTLLMLRCIAIWNRNKWVTIAFVVIGGGLWGVLMHGVTTVRASWDDASHTCAVESITDVYLTLVYLYTMFTDLAVLLLTLAGLSWSPGRSGLWRMLWDQGVMFFFVAFIANLIPAVILLVDLNAVFNIMFSIPAIAATATCACRCFVGLSEYARKGDDLSAALASNPTGGWTHRLQGPTNSRSGFKGNAKGTIGGGPLSPTTVQFTRERQRPGPLDTIDGLIRSVPEGRGYYDERDIHLDNLSPTKYEEGRGSDDTLPFAKSAASMPQLRRDSVPQLRRDSVPQLPQIVQRRGSEINAGVIIHRRPSEPNMTPDPRYTFNPSADKGV